MAPEFEGAILFGTDPTPENWARFFNNNVFESDN
jgi:hypothetical protein